MSLHKTAWLTLALLAFSATAEAKKMAPPTRTVDYATSKVDWKKPPAAKKDRAWKPASPKVLKLANGLNVWVVENHRLPLVTMELVVEDAGSASDGLDRRGLAGLTADLLDEGAGSRNALELGDRASSLGATLELAVSPDGAHVEVSTLGKTVDQTIDLLTDVLTTPKLTEADFKRIKDDRLTGLRLRGDRPREVAALALQQQLFGSFRYGAPRAGTVADVEKLTLDNVKAYYASHWLPQRMTLVVVGDVTPAALKKKLDATLGTWKPATSPSATESKSAVAKGRLLVYDRPGAEQTELAMGIVGINNTDKRVYPAEVLNTILGGAFTSRLNQRLREQLGYTYGIGSSFATLREAGPFQIRSGLSTPTTADALAEILTIVKKLGEETIPADELNKSKQYIVRLLPQSFESNGAAASSYADLALGGLAPGWFNNYAAKIGAVKAKELNALAATLLPVNDMVIVLAGDWKVIGEGVKKLGLGEPTFIDAEGNPLRK